METTGSHRDLVTSLKEGNEKSFELIYDLLANRLYLFILRKVGIKETAEEILQEVFVALWNNRHTMDANTFLDPYLFKIAKNKIFSFMRSEHVRKKYAAEFSLFMQKYSDNSLEELMDVKDLHQVLHERISELPDKCQTAFRMSRMEHASISQIAEQMNISTRTVENYITQALRHLRTHLNTLFALFFSLLLI
ncbi:RNA polymerase sigma-70 factor [Chryseolinea soli]|uniref:RNA polymerase sigma-70 factor n=1 Tax=Chryseolinea soli TaxID=2321403 RepID=A0A385SKW7_9BACT|nr:RNA polymerase sigma-70 factor [Chryseolinea soli]AYB31001.1 RNA polymerase sigma-70 factor [Chryseolinea soli]